MIKKTLNLKQIFSPEDIADIQYIYVLHKFRQNENYSNVEKYIGQEYVLNISHLGIPVFKNSLFIKLEYYLERHEVINNDSIFAIYHNIDLKSISNSEILEGLNQINNKISELGRHNSHLMGNQVLKEIYLMECYFSNLKDPALIHPPSDRLSKKVYYHNCFIDYLIVQSTKYSVDTIVDCHISNLIQEDQRDFTFRNNRVDNLVLSSQEVDLANVYFKLYHHKKLGKAKLKFDNVEIMFDKKLVKSTLKSKEKGYWNTFNYLHNNEGLYSERLDIEKYINYFSSRDSLIKKLLFKFHKGYTSLFPPLTISFICILINYYILFFGLNHLESALLMIFYPVLLFKNVILKDINIYYTFSLEKLIVLIVELLFIYSAITVGITLKKLYGFKIFK